MKLKFREWVFGLVPLKIVKNLLNVVFNNKKKHLSRILFY